MRILSWPNRKLKEIYLWTLAWAKSPHARPALFLIAFIESSCFPIPPDVLLIAMVLANRKSWFITGLICTVGSVCGALLGYMIGWGFYETIGKVIVQTYHLEETVRLIGLQYNNNAFLTVFTAAFTPIPYKAITITAGLFKISLAVLIIASVIGRGARFFLVALLLRIYGEKIGRSLEKYFDLFTLIFMALFIIGIVLLKYVF